MMRHTIFLKMRYMRVNLTVTKLMFEFISTDQMKAQEKEGSLDPLIIKKFGVGGINRALKSSWCPIHFATVAGHKV